MYSQGNVFQRKYISPGTSNYESKVLNFAWKEYSFKSKYFKK